MRSPFNLQRKRSTNRLSNLAKDEQGTTAIEFAMVIGPFLLLLFGIISVGFYFFVTFSLEHAVESASRVIRTGQAQTASTPLNDVTFKAKVCEKLPPFMSCGTSTDKIRVNVETRANYGANNAASCLTNTGALIPSTSQVYNAGTTNSIVLVTVCYEWELSRAMMNIPYWISPTSARMTNGSTLIRAATVFTNEPF